MNRMLPREPWAKDRLEVLFLAFAAFLVVGTAMLVIVLIEIAG